MGGAVILRGPDVVLRAPRSQDVADRLALGTDLDIHRMFGGSTQPPPPPLTAESVERWLKQLVNHPHAWIVEHDGSFLGVARLDGLNKYDRRARLATGLYDPARLGRGLGRQVVHCLLRHAFDDLDLFRVDLRVLAYNERAIRCYRACGFVREGRERKSAVVDGERYDDLIMGILAHEYGDWPYK